MTWVIYITAIAYVCMAFGVFDHACRKVSIPAWKASVIALFWGVSAASIIMERRR